MILPPFPFPSSRSGSGSSDTLPLQSKTSERENETVSMTCREVPQQMLVFDAIYFLHTPGCSLGWHLVLAALQCSHAVGFRLASRSSPFALTFMVGGRLGGWACQQATCRLLRARGLIREEDKTVGTYVGRRDLDTGLKRRCQSVAVREGEKRQIGSVAGRWAEYLRSDVAWIGHYCCLRIPVQLRPHPWAGLGLDIRNPHGCRLRGRGPSQLRDATLEHAIDFVPQCHLLLLALWATIKLRMNVRGQPKWGTLARLRFRAVAAQVWTVAPMANRP